MILRDWRALLHRTVEHTASDFGIICMDQALEVSAYTLSRRVQVLARNENGSYRETKETGGIKQK